jgi:hypothetical protein
MEEQEALPALSLTGFPLLDRVLTTLAVLALSVLAVRLSLPSRIPLLASSEEGQGSGGLIRRLSSVHVFPKKKNEDAEGDEVVHRSPGKRHELRHLILDHEDDDCDISIAVPEEHEGSDEGFMGSSDARPRASSFAAESSPAWVVVDDEGSIGYGEDDDDVSEDEEESEDFDDVLTPLKPKALGYVTPSLGSRGVSRLDYEVGKSMPSPAEVSYDEDDLEHENLGNVLTYIIRKSDTFILVGYRIPERQLRLLLTLLNCHMHPGGNRYRGWISNH